MENPDIELAKKKLFKVAMILILVGALNWLMVGALEFNLVDALLGEGSFASKIVYISVGLAGLSIMFFRDTYLPFLGEAVAPVVQVLTDKAPDGATRSKRVQVEPGQKVLYWAAEPTNEALKKIPTWKQAYAEYKNVGVATADRDGLATLKVRDPQSYTVPFKGRLEPHIHYRVCYKNGFMGRVETVYIEPTHTYEGFDNGDLVALV